MSSPLFALIYTINLLDKFVFALFEEKKIQGRVGFMVIMK